MSCGRRRCRGAADADRGRHRRTRRRSPVTSCMREVLALSLCHSKSAVPAPPARRPRRTAACHAPRRVHRPRSADGGARASRCGRRGATARLRRRPSARYRDVDVARRSPGWWTARPAARRFVADVIDAIRVLRAADALRQRGTTQRTSAGYEVCVDRRSGRAVMAVRSATDRFGALMWVDKHHSIAEGQPPRRRPDGSRGRCASRSTAASSATTERPSGSSRHRPRRSPTSRPTCSAASPDVRARHDRLASSRSCRRQTTRTSPRLVVEALEHEHPQLAGRTVRVDEPHPVPPSRSRRLVPAGPSP